MTAVTKHLGTLLLAVSCAVAQTPAGPATVRKIVYTRQGADLQVEVTLSSPVQPSIETAVNPDRILLDFPGTVSGESAPKVEINTDGVRRVRTGQHSAAPPVTRVVLDLDQAHPYTMKAEGNRIIITVSPAVGSAETASKVSHGGAPASAMSGGLTGIFRHKEGAPAPLTADRAPGLPPPPAPLPPLTAGPGVTRPAPSPTVVAAGTIAVPNSKNPASSSGTPPSFSPKVVAGGNEGAPGQVSAAGFPTATAGTPGSNSGTVASTTFDAKADAAAKAAAVKAAKDKVAEDKAAQDKAAEAQATAAKAAEEKALQDRAADLNAAEVKAAEVKAAEVKAAEVKAAELKAAEDKAAEEKAIAAKAAEENAQQDQASLAKAAEDKAVEEKAIAAKVAEEKAQQDKAAEAKAAEDKAIAAKAAEEKALQDKAAEAKAAEDKAAAAKAAVQQALEAMSTAAQQAAAAKAAEVPETETKGPASAPPPAISADGVIADAANPNGDGGIPMAATPVPAETMLMARADDPSLRTVFKVKYVADGVAYLEGGRSQGLNEGMKLQVEETNLPTQQGASAHAANDPRVVAELEVSGVAETSSVTEIHDPKRAVKAGDLAYLSVSDTESLVQQRSMSSTRQYPAVISFSEGDPLDEDAREEVPRPPSPSVNRARGRIGLDYNTTTSRGSNGNNTSSNLGFAFQGDVTRIGGTFWSLSGYYRGRFTKQPAGTQTLQDLINHTYHLSLTYDNPTSKLVAGVGRLYLPWATSLDTLDGGYVGLHPKQGVTLGVFGGSTPDPTSWSYAPNRAISGSFVNFEGGDYEHFHYSATSGGGISMINWAVNRPFVFFEDTVSWGRRVGIYEAAQIDSPSGNGKAVSPGFGLGRSFLTLRYQPLNRLELNFNYNYFRDVPTADPALLGTTLLDKFLFQGFSAGARVEVLKQIFVSGTLGRSNRSGDKSASLNEQVGITFNRLPWWKLRADARYSRFNSSFGTGSYESISVSRQLSDTLRLEFLGGQQNFTSAVTSNNKSRFYTSTVESTLGPHYYVQGNFTLNRGELNYDQYLFSFGYRFDNRARGRR